jgi:hypothetical protein
VIGYVAHALVLGDDELLEIHALAQLGLKIMQSRNGGVPEPRSMTALREIAKQVISTSGRGLRTSQVIKAESVSSIDDVPDEVTVSQIAPFTPWGDHEIRCKIRRGEIPIIRRKPVIMLSRDLVLAYVAHPRPKRSAA